MKTKRIRNSGAGSCLLELVGVLLIVFTFWTVIGAVIGFAFLIFGHMAAYRSITVCKCSKCGEFPCG